MTDEPSTLPALLSWFRQEWEAETGVRVHVRDIDAGGAPEWNRRFEALLQGATGGSLRTFPLRHHLRQMGRRGTHNYRRARFLYVLACQGFQPKRAASALAPAGKDRYLKAWADSYATFALLDLYRRVHDPERNHEDGTPRTFVQKRIGKSEAQAMAETAA